MNDYMPSKFNIVINNAYLDRNQANLEVYTEDGTVLFSRQKSGWPECQEWDIRAFGKLKMLHIQKSNLIDNVISTRESGQHAVGSISCHTSNSCKSE